MLSINALCFNSSIILDFKKSQKLVRDAAFILIVYDLLNVFEIISMNGIHIEIKFVFHKCTIAMTNLASGILMITFENKHRLD